MTRPTVGLRVDYWPPPGDQFSAFAPLAATIVRVVDERTVDLRLHHPNGANTLRRRRNVALRQEGCAGAASLRNLPAAMT